MKNPEYHNQSPEETLDFPELLKPISDADIVVYETKVS